MHLFNVEPNKRDRNTEEPNLNAVFKSPLLAFVNAKNKSKEELQKDLEEVYRFNMENIRKIPNFCISKIVEELIDCLVYYSNNNGYWHLNIPYLINEKAEDGCRDLVENWIGKRDRSNRELIETLSNGYSVLVNYKEKHDCTDVEGLTKFERHALQFNNYIDLKTHNLIQKELKEVIPYNPQDIMKSNLLPFQSYQTPTLVNYTNKFSVIMNTYSKSKTAVELDLQAFHKELVSYLIAAGDRKKNWDYLITTLGKAELFGAIVTTVGLIKKYNYSTKTIIKAIDDIGISIRALTNFIEMHQTLFD